MKCEKIYKIYKTEKDIKEPFQIGRILSNGEIVAVAVCEDDEHIHDHDGALDHAEILKYISENHKEIEPEI